MSSDYILYVYCICNTIDKIYFIKHLTGTSTIIVNETMREFIKCSLVNDDIMNKCVDKSGFCDIHKLLQFYDASSVAGGDVRKAIDLKQGDILIFFGCFPHAGGSALDLDNMRLHVYAPIKHCPVNETNVVIVPSETSMSIDMFNSEPQK